MTDFSKLFKNTDDAESYGAGETVFSEGDAGDCMYAVIDGEVDVMVGGRVVSTAGAGSLVGEMALIDAGARSATAVAKTACRIAPVDEKRFLFLVQETPFFALEVMRLMVERLRKTNELL